MTRLNGAGKAPTVWGDRRLYLLILTALVLVQAVRIFSNSCRLFVFMIEQTDGKFHPSQWWTVIDIRSCFWLAIAPLLAIVVARLPASLWNKALAHSTLFATGLVLSGTIVQSVSYQQSLVREQFRRVAPESSDSAEGNASTIQEPNKVALLTPYEDSPESPARGFRYWIGEFAVGLTDYTVMAMVGYAVLYFRLSEQRSREAERLRSTLVESRHDALRNRLTHHFLFNTLNSISALTMTNGAAARTCISQLGELLRASVDSLSKGEVRLDQELRDLEIYLSLQQSRFGDNLEYSIDIAQGLERTLVPAFLLQPLVENSFEHGFHGLRGVARIWIVGRRDGDSCRLEVLDNGVGMPDAHELDERYGVGVTRERLDLQYKGDASIKFEPNLPRGLRVSITIPYRVTPGKIS